jgi:SAM-dependent methyltransferase
VTVSDPDFAEMQELRAKLEEEESLYAEVLAALDGIAAAATPSPSAPEIRDGVERLNSLWELPVPPETTGLMGRFRRAVWRLVAPSLARQQEFNSVLVQAANAHLHAVTRLHERVGDLCAALVRYAQRVLPVADARDRMASALATSRAELILMAFDRRQESLGRRLERLLALRDRVEVISEQLRAIEGVHAAAEPARRTAAFEAAADAAYGAFENRYRGTADEIRERLAAYVPLLRGLEPVVDLGCGRGELLDLLKEAGIAARGIDRNEHFVADCRSRGLDVERADLLAFVRAQAPASLGAVVASQVAEHLPPAVLQEMLRESHRALRPGGLLVIETVNPCSVVAFLEIYNRDLSHERPLHPETLRFLATAAGFSDVEIELRSPVEPAARLQAVPADGLPPAAARALNENLARLNGLLYAPQEYALLARR